jgi:hypothetical protein
MLLLKRRTCPTAVRAIMHGLQGCGAMIKKSHLVVLDWVICVA